VEERRKLLQVFLRSMHRYEYLWQSSEFSTFVRTMDSQVLYSRLHNKYFQNSENDRVERYVKVYQAMIRQNPQFKQLTETQLLRSIKETE